MVDATKINSDDVEDDKHSEIMNERLEGFPSHDHVDEFAVMFIMMILILMIIMTKR